MMREEVYQRLDDERTYQEQRWGVRNAGGQYVEAEHSVGDFLVFVDKYVADAKRALTTQASDRGALEELRKVAGLCVACFEQHGVPRRALGMVQNARDGEHVLTSQVAR